MKEQIRKNLLKQRNDLPLDLVYFLSQRVLKNIVKSEWYQKSVSIFMYLSFGKEVQTLDWIPVFRADQKKIGAPIVDKDTLIPVSIYSHTNFKKNKYGILEPQNTDLFYFEENTLILIPGIAFDKKGNRLGFGKGFYDRFLFDKKGIKAGVCFDFQILDSIPCEKHDITMDVIFTEKQIYVFKNEI